MYIVLISTLQESTLHVFGGSRHTKHGQSNIWVVQPQQLLPHSHAAAECDLCFLQSLFTGSIPQDLSQQMLRRCCLQPICSLFLLPALITTFWSAPYSLYVAHQMPRHVAEHALRQARRLQPDCWPGLLHQTAGICHSCLSK